MGQTITKALTPRGFSQDFTAALWQSGGAPTAGAYAVLTVNPAGNRNAFKLTAKAKGAGGNSISIEMLDPMDDDQPITCEVIGSKISVSLATDGDGAIKSTARQVCSIISQTPAAAALVRTEFVDDSGNSSNSTTAVAALVDTPLAGGVSSDAFKAWALLGTVKAGAVPVSWSVDCKAAFHTPASDLLRLKLWAYQAGAWYSGLFGEAEPSSGGPLSAVRAMAGRIASWLDSGATADDDYLIAANTTMKTTAYTLAATTLPAGALARRLSLTVTKTGGVLDTLGNAVIVGKDEDGAALTETLALVEGVNVSARRFLELTSITTAGWVRDAGAGSEDKIKAGYLADGVVPEADAVIYAILESDDENDLADDDVIGVGPAGSATVQIAAV